MPSGKCEFIPWKTDEVDEMNTLWGEPSTCEYFYYVPVFGAIGAIIWIVFIAISGQRGEQVARA